MCKKGMFLYLLIILPVFGVNTTNDQILQEKTLVDTLKNHMECKYSKIYEQGDLYCTLKFRGLEIVIAGANSKDGGTIYIHSLGENHTVLHCCNCIVIIFNDKDLAINFPLHIVIGNDGSINYWCTNKSVWAKCD